MLAFRKGQAGIDPENHGTKHIPAPYHGVRRKRGLQAPGSARGGRIWAGFPEEVTFEMGSEGEEQPARRELVTGAGGGQQSRYRDQPDTGRLRCSPEHFPG